MEDLTASAIAAAEEDNTRRAGRARRTVRAAVLDLVEDAARDVCELPDWAQRPLPDDLFTVLNTWLGATSWAEQQSLLRENLDLGSGRHEELRLAQMLYPEVTSLAELATIIDDIAARGADTVLAELGAIHAHADLLRQWLDTPTWTASRAFLRQEPGLLNDPRTLTALKNAADDPVIAQHLGIARLATRMPIAEVYDLVMDVSMAVDTAMAYVENGDRAAIGDVLLTAPHLLQLPFVAPFLLAVHAALTDAALAPSPDQVADLARAAAQQGTDTQRQAAAARLRRLARQNPAHDEALQTIIATITAPAHDEPAHDSIAHAGETTATKP